MSNKPTQDEIKIGDLVRLKDVAIGYPMLEKNQLGIGMIVAERTEDEAGLRLFMVHWAGTGKKRWEFPDDLIKLQHK